MKGKSINWRTAALAAAVILPGAALGQNISVNVNGDPVAFSGVGPRQVNGRVLVPLRGVMEKLGAYVGWDPATRTVTASKSGTDLSLHLGDRNAIVNGRNVLLDVPAQEIGGSTMVPLRFVGEALGADVRWEPTTYTVNILTSGSADQQIDPNSYTPPHTNPPAGAVSINSFDIDHTGTLRGGQEIRLTLMGTPGGQATFSIPGVITDVAMQETQPGTYVGTFRTPANSPINISRASAIARLRVGSAERMIQSGTTLGFDTVAPLLTAVTPQPRSRVNRPRPNISATFDDQGGTGVDPNTVDFRLDGRDLTRDAQITSTSLSYRPERPLASGRHEVSVRAQDGAGNPVEKTWSFEVVDRADVIRSFKYDAGGQEMIPGTEVTFTLMGEPGGEATFSVGDRVLDRRMSEVEPGKYVGTYTIRRNDNFENVPVTARLVTKSGDTFTYDAATRFNTRVGTLEAPTFTDPPEDSTIRDNRLVLKGRAAPGSRVHVRIDYSKTALGIFKMNGTLADTDVVADDNGRWQTDPIDLSTGLGGGGATFNVTAYTVGLNGKESAVTKMTLHR